MNPVSVSERANAGVIEEYHQRWLDNPDSVDPTWRAFFQGFTLGSSGQTAAAVPAGAVVDSVKQSGVYYLINAYRAIGHIQSHLDPLSGPPPASPKLELKQFRLSEADLDTVFDVSNFAGGGQMKLRDIVAALNQIYCGHVGVEYAHIQDQDARRWLQERIESTRLRPKFSKPAKVRMLRRVHKAELFEKFLHTKYVGQKRFSLEGGETIIAAIDAVIDHCPASGIEEIVMGMAHRGRLNVLTSILRKSFDLLFEQFSENYIPDTVAGDGDVKYHLGYESVLTTTTGAKVEVRLAANPSHLEIVNPVVLGKARAKQAFTLRETPDAGRAHVLLVVPSGEAALVRGVLHPRRSVVGARLVLGLTAEHRREARKAERHAAVVRRARAERGLRIRHDGRVAELEDLAAVRDVERAERLDDDLIAVAEAAHVGLAGRDALVRAARFSRECDRVRSEGLAQISNHRAQVGVLIADRPGQLDRGASVVARARMDTGDRAVVVDHDRHVVEHLERVGLVINDQNGFGFFY